MDGRQLETFITTASAAACSVALIQRNCICCLLTMLVCSEMGDKAKLTNNASTSS
jgi:hypothetical protein